MTFFVFYRSRWGFEHILDSCVSVIGVYFDILRCVLMCLLKLYFICVTFDVTLYIILVLYKGSKIRIVYCNLRPYIYNLLVFWSMLLKWKMILCQHNNNQLQHKAVFMLIITMSSCSDQTVQVCWNKDNLQIINMML